MSSIQFWVFFLLFVAFAHCQRVVSHPYHYTHKDHYQKPNQPNTQQQRELHVVGRIPSQVGSSANAISSRAGHEIGQGIGGVGSGIGEIPRALGKTAGSFGTAIGGTIGGVGDQGLDETIHVAEAVGDTARGVPVAAHGVVKGLTKGSENRSKRSTFEKNKFSNDSWSSEE